MSLEIELVGGPEVLIRLPQTTATTVIPAWSTWGDVYLPTLDDNQYQGTLPVEVRVRLAAPSVSEVYTGVVHLGDDESPPSSPAKVVEYTYDYRNRLIGREEDGDREAFVYDGEQVLLRFDDAGDLASRYLWGPGVDLLLTDEQLDTIRSTPLPLSFFAKFDRGHEFTRLSMEGHREFLDRLDPDRSLSAFDERNVRPVEAGRVRKSFLRHAHAFAQLFDAQTKSQNVAACRHS